ncbi:MAG: hypothetical protein ABFR36_02230 [Acidobacteriota bacterium]
MKYIPLRVYSVFSRGKGAVSPSGLASLMKKGGVMAVTDPFSFLAWERFYMSAKDRGLRFLPGMEIALRGSGSLLLFPRTPEGYFSLVASYNEKSLTSMKEVTTVFIPGRIRGDISSRFNNIRERMEGGDIYFGLEWNSDRKYLEYAEKEKIPVVWANPLRWTGSPESYKVVSSVFRHLPSGEADSDPHIPLYGPLSYSAIMKRWGKSAGEALKNTFVLADSVRFDFAERFGTSLGRSPVKGDRSGHSTRLRSVVERELKKTGAGMDSRERAEQELSKIDELGFAPYFLIAEEITRYCRDNGIYFNIRGSGGSSYVLFLLGLSRVDPMHHNLLFERFVNAHRDELPDIDIDIDSSRRGEVLKWVFRRFSGKAAFISTHKLFRARSALYEVARSFGIDPEESHRMSREIDVFASPSELKGRGTGQIREINDKASLLKNVYRELSLHLGGVIFSERDIRESFPVEVSPHGFDQVAWDKETIERLKIFKLDLLGVRGFDVISPYVSGNSIDFKDDLVWEAIKKAATKGCFQLESPLARENLMKAAPSNLEELAISIAIIRPGPAKSGMKKAYLEKREPFHSLLGEIFSYTRGALIYEEQISVLIHHVTGWGLEVSEKVRRSLKKRRGEEFREGFLSSGREKGWSEKELTKFWKMASDFSLYAFNNAHSISYAYSAYASAWMKTRHPVRFFSRLFNSGGGYYPLPVYIEEARECGLRLLPPDINLSNIGFSEEDGAIRTGLIFIKGVGSKLSSLILKERGAGYSSLEDFINKTRVGERDLSTLMAVSALNSIGYNGFSEEELKKNWNDYLGFIPDKSG